MAASLRALVLRLLGARGRAPEAAPRPPRREPVYRTSNRREDEHAGCSAEMDPLTAMIRLLRPSLQPITTPLGEPELSRLDPPGLLDGWSILGVRQWFYEYICRPEILFERGGERYLYCPLRDSNAGGDRLSALPGHRLEGAWLVSHEVDFAPILRKDLERSMDAGDRQNLGELVALVHMIGTLTGRFSQELRLPSALMGAPALDLLAQRLEARREDVRAALTERALTGDAEPSARSLAVLIDRHITIDGMAGGYEATLSLGRLSLSSDGWAYAWEVLWSESREGEPTS